MLGGVVLRWGLTRAASRLTCAAPCLPARSLTNLCALELRHHTCLGHLPDWLASLPRLTRLDISYCGAASALGVPGLTRLRSLALRGMALVDPLPAAGARSRGSQQQEQQEQQQGQQQQGQGPGEPAEQQQAQQQAAQLAAQQQQAAMAAMAAALGVPLPAVPAAVAQQLHDALAGLAHPPQAGPAAAGAAGIAAANGAAPWQPPLAAAAAVAAAAGAAAAAAAGAAEAAAAAGPGAGAPGAAEQPLTRLPDLGRLTGLVALQISNNELTRVPAFLGSLPKLEWLDLSDNVMMEVSQQRGLAGAAAGGAAAACRWVCGLPPAAAPLVPADTASSTCPTPPSAHRRPRSVSSSCCGSSTCAMWTSGASTATRAQRWARARCGRRTSAPRCSTSARWCGCWATGSTRPRCGWTWRRPAGGRCDERRERAAWWLTGLWTGAPVVASHWTQDAVTKTVARGRPAGAAEKRNVSVAALGA